MNLPQPLVDTDWLTAHLGADRLVVIDASWRMPGDGAARPDYERRHIPGAVFFDIDEIADPSTDLPHMLPTPASFAAAMGAFGVADDAAIVVYDDRGVFSAARVWWTFKAMGHRTVSVLDGGLKAWLDEGRPTTAQPTAPQPRLYKTRENISGVATADDVRRAAQGRDTLILDARPTARFFAQADEPRPGLRRGHIPHSRSLPFGMLTTPEGKMRRTGELEALFAERGLDERPLIATCGSGVTACVIALALAVIGREDVRVYDGSYAEWGRKENDPREFPVVVGDADQDGLRAD